MTRPAAQLILFPDVLPATKRPAGKGGPFAGKMSREDYFFAFFAGAAGAVAAGSWVLGWMASMTGVAMKTEA